MITWNSGIAYNVLLFSQWFCSQFCHYPNGSNRYHIWWDGYFSFQCQGYNTQEQLPQQLHRELAPIPTFQLRDTFLFKPWSNVSFALTGKKKKKSQKRPEMFSITSIELKLGGFFVLLFNQQFVYWNFSIQMNIKRNE